MNRVYLLTGGNEGDRLEQLRQAAIRIALHCGQIDQRSAVYETAAWGKTDQAPFLNQALALQTDLDPASLLEELLAIETKMGRIRTEKFGSRTIDIDILLFNQEQIDHPDLKIPHPELQNRRFALEPLNEIAPEWNHPRFHKTIRQLLAECKDPLDVKKI
jgi:2-amino-4-hydroxy-6-hydroxymethyldihydropteridine diphosphokinase